MINLRDNHYAVEVPEGATDTEWAGRAKRILDVLEKIKHAPVPANENEYMAWFVAVKNIARGAISEWEADTALAKYKEVSNA